MEPFRTSSSFNKNDFIRGCLIRWKILNRKNRKQIISWSVVSIVFLLLWIITKTEEKPTNPYLFFGVLFSLFTLLLVYIRIFSKRIYTRKIKEFAEKYDSIKMEHTYEFSDESIKYWDKEKKLEFNWSVFTNYSIYKNYLLIILNNSLIDSYIFEKDEKDIDIYNRILEIVESKLEYKKIG